MLSNEGKEHLQLLIPYLNDDQLNSYANNPKLTDEIVQTVEDRYLEKFGNHSFKEMENLMIGLMDGISLNELDHCVDVCMMNKQKPPYLHYKESNGRIDTSETIRLYCLAYQSGESLDHVQHLDSMVECLEKAENLAECYNVGTGVQCLIKNEDDLHNYCLTPSNFEEIYDFADSLNNPTIGIVYNVDFAEFQISARILPNYPYNDLDSYKNFEPFMIRKFNSFRTLNNKINDAYSSAFIAMALGISRNELSKAVNQNNEYMGKDYKFKDVVFNAWGKKYSFDDIYAYAEQSKNKNKKKTKSKSKSVKRSNSGPEL